MQLTLHTVLQVQERLIQSLVASKQIGVFATKLLTMKGNKIGEANYFTYYSLWYTKLEQIITI